MSHTGSVYTKREHGEKNHLVQIEVEEGVMIITLVDYKWDIVHTHTMPLHEAASTAEAILHYCKKQGIREYP